MFFFANIIFRNRRSLAYGALSTEDFHDTPQHSRRSVAPSSSIGNLNQSSSKFGLDPKFFADLDATMENPALNRTFKVGSGKKDTAGLVEIKDSSPIDFKPIVCYFLLIYIPFSDYLQKPILRQSVNFSRRSESVSSISSLESAEHIDKAIHNISCLTIKIADEAIAQVSSKSRRKLVAMNRLAKIYFNKLSAYKLFFKLLLLLHDPVNRQYVTDRTELIFKTFVTQVSHFNYSFMHK